MAEKIGKVWLVGAGPSDAGLMTLRGLEVLREADVVVYDRLVGAEILFMASERAEKIYAGKREGRHTLPQEEISRLLLRRAQAGEKVVRLKGGDPFLFGRGGEELELLARHGIPFEVVPGVTSAVAVPAYAGIPVTHRALSSSVHIFTGRISAGSREKMDFGAAVRLGGTLVFLMGVSSVRTICDGLLGAGMPRDTPAAAVESGTTARQRTALATLGRLAAELAARRIRSPAVIVVGPTAALAGRFDWAGRRPLHGRRVVVTRPRRACGEFCAALRRLGAEALPFPCIETAPSEDAVFREAFRKLGDFSWLVFLSAAGVGAFFDALCGAGLDARRLAGLKIAAVGDATGKSLASRGVLPDLVPRRFSGEALGEALAGNIRRDDRLLLIGAKKTGEGLARRLSQAEASFEELAAYETRTAPDGPAGLRERVESGDFDAVAFMSASAVAGFGELFPSLAGRGLTAICIGRETAAQAQAAGYRAVTANTADTQGMLDALVDCFGGKS